MSNPPLEVRSFLGGPTDEYTNAQPNQYQRGDNVFLLPNGDTTSRGGSLVYDVANAQLPSGNQRVGTLINFQQDSAIIAQSARHIYVYNAGWSEILTQNATAALNSGTTANRLSTDQWRGQLFVVSDSGANPIKIFQDSTSAWRAISTGLPRFPNGQLAADKITQLANAITLANDIRSKMVTHFASVVAHAVADAHAFAAAATDEPTLVTLVNDLILAYFNHILDARKRTAVIHNTANHWNSFGNFYLRELAPPSDLWSAIPVLNEIKRCFNFHHDAWFMSVGTTIDTHTHPADTGKVTAAYVTIHALPAVNLYPLAAANPVYTYVEENRAGFALHLADVLANGHLVSNSKFATGISVVDDDTMTTVYYKLLVGYAFHVGNGSTGVWHNGLQTGPEDFPIADALIPLAIADSIPYFALDPGNVAADLNTIIVGINAFVSQMVIHVPLNRHKGTGNTWDLYLPNTGFYTYLPTNAFTINTYEYAFVYKNQYTTLGGLTFIDESTPYVMQTKPRLSSYGQFDTVFGGYYTPHFQISLSNIPSMSASGSDPSTSVVKEIFRSIANGTTLFKLGEIPNSQTSYTDYASDSAVEGFETIYTAGGVVENDPPPAARYLTMVNGFSYYGYPTDDFGIIYPNRVMQSIQNAPGACPGTFFIDLPQPVQGLSSTKSVVVAWTKFRTYRIEGYFDELGRGSMSYTVISDATGLSGPWSPVQLDDGILFAGNDGFYMTDGYIVQKLTRQWRATYLSLIASAQQKANIQGTYDRANKRVWWATTTSGAENDSVYILDLNFPLIENSIFTSASNGASFAPSAICYFGGQVLRGDSRGYVLKHDDTYLSDPKIDTSTAASTWQILPIRYDLRTIAFDFGSTLLRKWVPRITLKARNKGNLSLQINSMNDDARVIAPLTPIRWRGTVPTSGNLSIVTGVGGPSYPNRGIIEEKRHFPNGSLRCETKQLQLTNAFVVISGSDTLGKATLNHAAKTLTIDAGTWPTNVSDHVITLETDGYVNQFVIASQTTTVLTLLDPGGLLPANGDYKWQIQGYPKDEKMQLISFSMPYEFLGDEHVSGEVSGANT